MTLRDNDGYKNIYESALREWQKQSYDKSLGLFEEAKRLSEKDNDIFSANKALNEIEIRQKKVSLTSRPRVIHVTLTDRCNLRCPFCYLDRYATRWDMPAQGCEEIIKFFPYLQRLTWQGGEAFMHPYFKKMLLEAIEFPNIQHTILTNGSFLNDEWLDLFLKIKKFTIVISLESVRWEVYEDLRRGASLERLKRNLSLVNSLSEENNHRLDLVMNIIVMKRNYLETEEMIDFAIENKFGHVILTSLYPNNSEFFDREYASMEDEQIRRYFSAILPSIFEKTSRRNIFLDDRFTGIAKEDAAVRQQINYTEFCDRAICLSPWQQLFIESTGEVKSYCSCVHALGNLKDSSIEEIWNNETVKRLRQDILNYDYNKCNRACVSGALDKSNLKLT